MDTQHTKTYGAEKAALRGELINAYIKKQERTQISNLTLQPKDS